MSGHTLDSEPCTTTKITSADQIQGSVVIGNSKLVWHVDSIQYGYVYLNRQHMRGGRGHHLSFRQMRIEDAIERLSFVTYPPAN